MFEIQRNSVDEENVENNDGQQKRLENSTNTNKKSNIFSSKTKNININNLNKPASDSLTMLSSATVENNLKLNSNFYPVRETKDGMVIKEEEEEDSSTYLSSPKTSDKKMGLPSQTINLN